jgi:hypothetical protein
LWIIVFIKVGSTLVLLLSLEGAGPTGIEVLGAAEATG